MMHILKRIGKDLLCRLLEAQVRRLRKKHSFTLVAVSGSVGKTSTKLAIAHLIEPTRRVMYQTGNYNDRLTLPLVLFGHDLPSLFNIPAWLRILIANERTIRLPRYYDIAVVELGTDRIGDIVKFAYLQPDLTVVTAITAEHMSMFKSLDAVAKEELTVLNYSKTTLINGDDTPDKFLKSIKDKKVLTYGYRTDWDFQALELYDDGLLGTSFRLQLQDQPPIQAKTQLLGLPGVKIVLAAASVGQLLGLSVDEIQNGLPYITPMAGRMQLLFGIHDSRIIDDTYNASPEPVLAALDVLYQTQAPQRIAILGSMNELGDVTAEAHTTVGKYCRTDKLDLVITIGAAAAEYLAPVAEAQGCKVKTFMSPYAAGKYVRNHLKPGAVVLAKGSQNGVFAEEAVKLLLADPSDASKLVRQSNKWMAIKRKQFDDSSTSLETSPANS